MTEDTRIVSVPIGSSLLDAIKLAFVDDIKAALEGLTDDAYDELRACDNQGQTALHMLAANSKDACLDLLLKKAGDDAPNLIALQDNEGNTSLHLCAHCPMSCYQLAAESPATCLIKNKAGLTPIDLALQHGSGEALNALLLACSGNSSPDVIDSMNELTRMGAVADTWAPNGQSSLMLAAAANSAEAITLLLSAGASLELQDAMGRTALMWAAGSDAVDALKVLLDAGASVALRDRRNRTACDYAEKPDARKVLEARVKELESKATAAQEALLAELLEEEERKAASKATKRAKKKIKAKEKKEKSGVVKGSGTSSTDGAAGEETIATSTSSDTTASEATKVMVEGAEANPEPEEDRAEIDVNETTPMASSQITTTTTASTPLPYSRDATEVHHNISVTATVTKTPPAVLSQLLAARVAVRPPSPEWCTVGAPKKEKSPQHSGTFISTKSVFSQHHYQHRRSPSIGSVNSVSSGTSHETDGSGKHSGSERSVLRRVAAAGAVVGNNSSSQQFAVPRPPAPVQRQAACTRSTSGGEEVGAAALFGDSGTTSTNATTAVAAAAIAGIKPGSWASVAASQRNGTSNGNSAAAAFVAAAAGALQVVSKREEQQQQQEPAHTTLASGGPPQGAWTRLNTGLNTLTTSSGGSSIDGSHSNYGVNNINTATAATTTAPAASISTASVAALQRAAAEEIAVLRSEIQRLKLRNAAAELAHHQELVAVLQDASQHENAAVAKATSDERVACSMRFAALLQNNGVALAGAIPGLLAGAGINTASDLDIFLNLNGSNAVGGSGGINTGHRCGGGVGDGSATAVPNQASSNRKINLSSPHMADTYSSSINKNITNKSTLAAAISGDLNNAVPGGGAGVCADTSPLSTSPFSYEVGEHLRGDFFGNHSAFMVPATETHSINASPPDGGYASSCYSETAGPESFMTRAAAAASAWSPLGNGTSTGWGTPMR
ncbi:hypothetical protein Ndes2526B_g07955 [Nannochloris sp. 'desiccata']|nr:hypothetical protein NADE_007131 [Chlorella desiccata (nom. nud.)]